MAARSTVIICCLIYPLAVWAIGQTLFPFTANGSMVNGPDGKPVGSLLIAQPFTKDEYFWPRPSAASYDELLPPPRWPPPTIYCAIASRGCSDRLSLMLAAPKRANS